MTIKPRSGIRRVGLARKPELAREYDPTPFVEREKFQRLIERWQAPVMDESTLDGLGAAFELMPKVGATFAEFLIMRGFGEMGEGA